MELPSSLEEWKEGTDAEISTMHNCYCPNQNCGKSNGLTHCLPTKVPFFREVIIMSFECPDCYYRNSEVTFGGEIQAKGVRISCSIKSREDLNRQIIKSDSCTIFIPALQMEIPPETQRGTTTTVEGMIKKAADGLEEGQPQRVLIDVDVWKKIQKVIEKLRKMVRGKGVGNEGAVGDGDGDGDSESESEDDSDDDDGEEVADDADFVPFELVLDDPSGNSYVSMKADARTPEDDKNITKTHYERTATQDMSLGLQPSSQAVEAGTIDDSNPSHKNPSNTLSKNAISVTNTEEDRAEKLGRREVMQFPTECPSCHKPSSTDMCVTDIPHFKEVIIMSLNCDHCGYRSNEIKGGGAIPKFGTEFRLVVNSEEDMGREVLKSDTAGIAIPEIELELEEGSLSGIYTTVEGLMQKLVKNMTEANPFGSGDSNKEHHLNNDGGNFTGESMNEKYTSFISKLMEFQAGKRFPFTIVVSDPLSNSFVGPVPADAAKLAVQAEEEGNSACYDAYVDSAITIKEYTRTDDQNELLGLNDLKTENYNEELKNYGTDQQSELSDRLQNPEQRGPDHPHKLTAPLGEDTTVFGEGSTSMAIPSIGKRGEVETARGPTEVEIILEAERGDKGFAPCGAFSGRREGFVFKKGALGLGYYTDDIFLGIQ